MSHHANDGSASRVLRRLLREHSHGDPATEIAGATTQQIKCARGEHDETVALPRYTTYVRGSQVTPGTRYCRYCSLILPAGEG